jgi:hypothetical protein
LTRRIVPKLSESPVANRAQRPPSSTP